MRRLAIFLMVVFGAGCVEPVSLKITGGGPLVVDGWITNQPGPYTIKLSRSIPFDNSQPLKVYSVPERNAKLSIVYGNGNIETLTENSTAGSYNTNTLLGTVGVSYQLLIETSTGIKYHSTFEEMKPVPNIGSLQAVYQVSEVLFINANGSSRKLRKEDFAIYVNVNDPVDTENYYRWKANGLFEFFSFTETSGVSHCWAPTPGRIESRLELASDLYFDGKSYSQYIGVVPYDRPTYYLVSVRQQSLTASGYNFLKRISNQQTITGTLFDPPATAITGNITNDANSDEVVLGYFGVAAETQASLLINRFKTSNYVNPSRYLLPKNGDCRTHEPNATNIKPPGF